MEKIKLDDLCVPSARQIKEDPDKLIDYIDIASVVYLWTACAALFTR